MGGKRPDQHNIDPGEAGATNYQWRGEGRSEEEHVKNEDKRHLQANRAEQPMIPEENVNPALRELRERKQSAQGGQEETWETRESRETRETRDLSEGDARIDEQSKESFPASDPPQQP